MIKVGVGLSQKRSTVIAVQEASRRALNQANLTKADWVLVFFNSSHLVDSKKIHQTLISETQCKDIAGCSGAGVLTLSEEIVDGPGIVVMVGASPDITPLAFIHYQERPSSPSVSQQLKETLENFSSSPLLFLFPDTYTQHPYNLINTLNYVSTSPRVFGAGSCDDGLQQHSIGIGPNGARSNGVSGLCFSGKQDITIGITQSCTPIGEPMFITKVEDNVIVSLDDFSALEVFSTLASNQGLNDINTAAQNILIAFPLDNGKPEFTGEACLLRPLSGIDASKQGLVVPQIIEEGGVLSFMHRTAITAENDLHSMLQRIKQKRDSSPLFGIYLNCAARGETLYKRPNVDTQAIHEYLGDFPLIGFFGGFELASVSSGLQLYSYTGVLILFYE